MKRILPLLLVLPLAAFACKSKSSADDNDNGAQTGENGENGDGTATEEELGRNPIEGIAPPKAVVETFGFTDGPVWHKDLNVLIFSMPLGEQPSVWRMLPDGRRMQLRQGNRADGSIPIGNSIAPDGTIVGVEAKRLVRMVLPADGKGAPDVQVIATGYPPGGEAPPVPDPADPNAPPPSAPGEFDTLNDVVARKDGTMYVTDPGYFATPIANRIYRVTAGGEVQVVEAFDDVPRPNGIALSPDEKTLYVGFSRPTVGTLPFVRQYNVNDDGTLGEWTKFVDIGPEDADPDGLAVDQGGNVYVATKAGIEVYKADGMKIGVVAVPEVPTGMTFGGKDMKSMYVTTQGSKIWELRLNVPGLSQ